MIAGHPVNAETEFVVMDSAARMPSKCWGRYRRVAVVEIERGAVPKMISSRARGVVRIVKTWERCHAQGMETAFSRAMEDAQMLAAILTIRQQEWSR